MAMFEHQFATIFKVGIHYIDERLSKVREREKQFLFDAFPIAIGNLIDSAFGVVCIGEEAMLVAKLFGKESIDERDVVVDSPGFEDFFSSETEADIPFTFGDVIVTIVVILTEFAFI